MPKLFLLLALSLLSFAGRTDAAPGSGVGRERLLLGGDRPDPSILRDGDTYYMVHSSFEYVPGLLVYRSHDLLHWEPLANALQRYVGSVYAPDIVKYGGRLVIHVLGKGEPFDVQLPQHVWFRLRNDRHVLTFWYSPDGRTWTKTEKSCEASGYHHNMAGEFLSLRPGIYAAGNGEVVFRNFRYRTL